MSFFFFKQKTAYEIRISDWSSDVCSSDLDLHGELDNRTALVVGIGEMGDLMLRQLRAAGLVRVLLAGQSRHVEAAARRMAASTDCHFVALDALDHALAEADIVVTAAGTGRYAVSAAMVGHALKARRQRPLLLLDGGVTGA